MPPLPSQKGTGKKGRDARQSRSRNSTPNLPANTSVSQLDKGTTALLGLSVAVLLVPDDIPDVGSAIPSSKDLETLAQKLQTLVTAIENRGNICDKGMRSLAALRKERLEEIESDRRDEERKERVKADEEERGRHKANKVKKRKDISTSREERPLTHGAHGLAPQDGSNLGQYRQFTLEMLLLGRPLPYQLIVDDYLPPRLTRTTEC
jgi:transcriptional adapter 3